MMKKNVFSNWITIHVINAADVTVVYIYNVSSLILFIFTYKVHVLVHI